MVIIVTSIKNEKFRNFSALFFDPPVGMYWNVFQF